MQNCLRPSYYKEKIPYDKMDSKIKLLHVIIGLINKGKQRQTKAKKLRMVVPFFSYACMWRASRADH